ncbi:MAG: hypothetical protein PHN72_03605 [Bacilli bacterium]|nr:hypothetical protein [Bacilli bacterium]
MYLIPNYEKRKNKNDFELEKDNNISDESIKDKIANAALTIAPFVGVMATSGFFLGVLAVGINNYKTQYFDNNPDNSKGYYVFKENGKTTIYDTFGYNGKQVDYTKNPNAIGINKRATRIYQPENIDKEDLLIQEQTVNRDGIVVFVDNYGVASFYEGYELVEKIDLVAKKVINIDGENEDLIENTENAHEYAKQKKLTK